MKSIKCIWCSKKVAITKNGNLASHLTSGGLKCVGIGVNANKVKDQLKLIEAIETNKKAKTKESSYHRRYRIL